MTYDELTELPRSVQSLAIASVLTGSQRDKWMVSNDNIKAAESMSQMSAYTDRLTQPYTQQQINESTERALIAFKGDEHG